jgi:hypothetical protein
MAATYQGSILLPGIETNRERTTIPGRTPHEHPRDGTDTMTVIAPRAAHAPAATGHTGPSAGAGIGGAVLTGVGVAVATTSIGAAIGFLLTRRTQGAEAGALLGVVYGAATGIGASLAVGGTFAAMGGGGPNSLMLPGAIAGAIGGAAGTAVKAGQIGLFHQFSSRALLAIGVGAALGAVAGAASGAIVS